MEDKPRKWTIKLRLHSKQTILLIKLFRISRIKIEIKVKKKTFLTPA